MTTETAGGHPAADGVSHCYSLLGLTVRVTAPVAVAAALELLLAGLRVAGDAPPKRHYSVVANQSGYEVRDETGVLHRAAAPPAVVDRLVAALNRTAIEDFDGFAVHAGVVAGAGSGAIALPGASGDGKSTMVAALLTLGLDYVSDEVLGVHFGSRAVVPYPKPLRLSPESQRIVGIGAAPGGVGERLITAADLGARISTAPLPVGHVVQFVRRHGPTRLAATAPAEAVTGLLRFSFNHYKDRERCFSLAVELADGCRSWRLEYEDAPEAAALLAERLVVA